MRTRSSASQTSNQCSSRNGAPENKDIYAIWPTWHKRVQTNTPGPISIRQQISLLDHSNKSRTKEENNNKNTRKGEKKHIHNETPAPNHFIPKPFHGKLIFSHNRSSYLFKVSEWTGYATFLVHKCVQYLYGFFVMILISAFTFGCPYGNKFRMNAMDDLNDLRDLSTWVSKKEVWPVWLHAWMQ